MADKTTSVRTSFLLVSILALAWLAFVGWALSATPLPQSPLEWAQILATALVPVTALYALVAAMGNRRTISVLAPPDSLEDGEARLSAVALRLDGLRSAMAKDLDVMAMSAAAIEEQSLSARQLAEALTKASAAALDSSHALESLLPKATQVSDQLSQTLQAATQQAQQHTQAAEHATSQIQSHISQLTAQAQEQIHLLQQALENLEAQSERGRTASESGMRSIRQEADGLFELLEHTLVSKQQAFKRQSEEMMAQVEDCYARIEKMGLSSSQNLANKMDSLSLKARQIEERIHAQSAATDALVTTGERAFQVLDARLNHSSETGKSQLDRLGQHIQQINAEIANLSSPIKEAQSATADLDKHVAALKETTLQTVDVLGETLPKHSLEASRVTATLVSELETVGQAIHQTYAHARALTEPVEETRAVLDKATQAYAEQRQAIEAAGQALVVELQQARLLIAEVEEQTRDTSLSAATRLVDAMSRVRDVANQTTGTMRDMLNGLIEEMRGTLSAVADDAMRQSFVEPIAKQAAEAERAASAAAERTASSMAALATTLRAIDARTEDRLGHLEQAQQADLLAAASLLTDTLSRQSISLASALGREMDDSDWAQWRKGERGLFNRRTVALLDKRESRELKALVESDSEFARHAREYVSSFDALLRRFEAQAPALMMSLQNSDQGRIAAALSEVLDA